ncbi:MAG: TrkH family potassium uptake protein [Ignavibacterium sp.]|nr:TrkH family potassium uptake protein [Ignavibacterium sp.]MCX7611941.1 TrkH family potassium uptake protein [Ignavibacterium sp.]MDW8376434.1 TrkH family potassium uptake protein [Ignavibacteriales bacterium]
MNYKFVFNFLGFLLMLTGALMLPGILFSLYYKDDDILAILLSSFITALTGFLLWFFTRKNLDKEIGKREGYLIVSAGWIFMSLFGTLPFVITGYIPSFTDAFFETVSGFTTTGATILSDIEKLPHGILFWRSMTHWIGGMGIIVLSIAILPLLGVGGMQLYQAEVAGPTKDKLHPRVQETAKRLWAIYVLFTMLETFLLLLGGMNLFDSLCHSFGTLASGGFSTKNQSIAYYNSPYIEYVIIIFMFIAGTNFSLHYLALKGEIKTYFQDSEFRFYFGLIMFLIISTGLFLTINNKIDPEFSFRQAAFSYISVLSSTGFSTVDYQQWAPFFTEIFLILLLFGACAGSTSGGVKMVRYQLLLKNSLMEFKRLIHPNAIIPVRHNGKAVHPEIIAKVGGFVLLYLFIFGISSVALNIAGMDATSSMGSVAACLANIGPGLNSTGPVTNYSSVPEIGKWILSFVMILGRLEIFTVLILFSPSFWKK